jgi:hypothetical protein
MATPASGEKGLLVVARFVDGRIIKGTTHDFAPSKAEFHLHMDGDERSHAVPVRQDSLKAVFFVKTFEGNKQHQVKYSFDKGGGQGGRKIRVRFMDGEEIAGFTLGYTPQKQGFFLVPADPDGNNERIYILNKAVSSVKWL